MASASQLIQIDLFPPLRQPKPAWLKARAPVGENFHNLKKQGGGKPDPKSAFFKAAEAGFGSYELWKTDFVGVGKMRGVGWAICFQDPHTGKLSNHWVTLHEIGNVAGYVPILVMDVWEHAFLLDYAPSQRPKYIEAFLANTDWAALDQRLAAAGAHAAR